MIQKWNLALLIVVAICAWTVSAKGGHLFCYYGSWSAYRPGNGKFNISNIQPNLCTHLIYAFAGVDQFGTIQVLDPWQDLSNNYGQNGFKRFNDLKGTNPNLKTLLAIGGWNHGSTVFSTLASSPSSRTNFVNNVFQFVQKYGFDGIDFAWLYPNQRGGFPHDVQNYNLLLQELYAKFHPNNLILSAAVAAVENSAKLSYDIRNMHMHVDYINLMSYDMRGVWDQMTGVNAPLHPAQNEQGSFKNVNVESAVKYWLEQGAPSKKLILGIPLYGKSFTLQNKEMNHIGSPIVGAGNPGIYTNTPGMLSYQEICEKIAHENGWVAKYDDTYQAPYAFSPSNNQWVGYEDPRSVKAKLLFGLQMALGGVNAWEIDFDDFHGSCHDSTYPLLRQMEFYLQNWV